MKEKYVDLFFIWNKNYLIWLIETSPTIPIGEKFMNFYIVVHLVQKKCEKLL